MMAVYIWFLYLKWESITGNIMKKLRPMPLEDSVV
jgi:hypothetical protein